VLPKAVDKTERVWTYFGYQDDHEEKDRHRIGNVKWVGPVGFIPMVDGEAVELCQNGIVGSKDEFSVIPMASNSTDDTSPIGMDENSVRGFWKGYRELMNIE
jgi:anthranilate 1,2-dioxygenase large subunit